MAFFIGFTLYGSSTLLPLMLQAQFGYDATLAGLVLSPGGLAVVFIMPLVGKLVSKYPAKYLIGIGMLALSIGMSLTSFFSPQTDYHTFVMLRICQVIGLPFLFIPSSTLAFAHIPPEKSNKASALYALIRNLGGSIGIALLLSYVARHEQLHQTVLSEGLNPARAGFSNLLARYTAVLLDTGDTPAGAALKAMSRIYQELLNQATLLAYADGFRLLALITFTLAGIALLMPVSKVTKPAAAH